MMYVKRTAGSFNGIHAMRVTCFPSQGCCGLLILRRGEHSPDDLQIVSWLLFSYILKCVLQQMSVTLSEGIPRQRIEKSACDCQ